jgi:ribosomal protein S16
MNFTVCFSRLGRKDKPFYRVIVKPLRNLPTLYTLDRLGFYDLSVERNVGFVYRLFVLNEKRFLFWLYRGARTSSSLKKLFLDFNDDIVNNE